MSGPSPSRLSVKASSEGSTRFGATHTQVGPAGKLEWQDLVPEEQRKSIDKKEQKRQM